MDIIHDDSSDTSERTAFSDSEDDTADGLTTQRQCQSSVAKLKKDLVDSVQVNLQLANLWQFLLSSSASALRRFFTYNFIPAETVTNIARGASYRVCRGKLNSTDSEQVVAIKHIILQPSISAVDTGEYRKSTLETVLRELRIQTHDLVRKNVNVAQLLSSRVWSRRN